MPRAPTTGRYSKALDHQGGGYVGLPPTRSATMGVRKRLPMLHTEMRLRITEADTSVRPCRLPGAPHRSVQCHGRTATPWISGRYQKARVRACGGQRPGVAAARSPDSHHHRRVVRGRPIGHQAQVGRAIAKEQGQRQDDAAANGPEAPEGALPAQLVEQHVTRGASRAAPSPPAPQESVAGRDQRRNQPLTAAISGTRQMDWVKDSSTLKVKRKCQGYRDQPQ